jgi:glycosyltransferase involved in cell wall biosynthesis
MTEFNNNHSPRFSILIVNYNMGNLVGEAIESALNQRFDSFEILVLDNCSTDSSWDVITSFRDERIKAIRQVVNLGMYNNLNVGMALTNGVFTKFHCADDLLHPDCLRVLDESISKYCDEFGDNLYLCHDKTIMSTEEISLQKVSWMNGSRSSDCREFSLKEKLLGGLATSCVPTSAFRKFGAFGNANPERDFSRDAMRLGLFSAHMHAIEIRESLVIERSHELQNRKFMPKRWQLNEMLEMYREASLLESPSVKKRVSFLAGQHLTTAAKSIFSDWSLVYLFHVVYFIVRNGFINQACAAGVADKLKRKFRK